MSIQTTRFLTREQAEQKFIEKWLKDEEIEAKKYVKTISNEEIEDYIEETFDNYEITDSPR